MITSFAKRVVKSSLDAFGYSLHDLSRNNDLRVFLPGHLRTILTKLRINCVIDVGANIGQYGRMLRRIGFAGRIVSIEPIQESFSQLRQTSAGDGDWITINAACGSRDETKSMNVFAQSGISSMLSASANMAALDSNPVERTDMVTVKRLASIFETVLGGIDAPRVFLKTDAQGHDLEVIKGAGEYIQQVEGLQAEVSLIPLYQGVPDYLDVLSYCREVGFDPTGFFPVFCSPDTSHLVECDVVLIRRHWSNIESALIESAPDLAATPRLRNVI
jgi:FkbM family methyltransferase